MIAQILDKAWLALAMTTLIPIFYLIMVTHSLGLNILFIAIGLGAAILRLISKIISKVDFKQTSLPASATTILLVYPVLALFGALPFILTGWLQPLDAFLETIGNLTSAGLSILPSSAPYILRLWQSSLMWMGSLLFLIMIVTSLLKVSDDFGISLSLQGGQRFSPIIGQMNLMSIRVIKIYLALTILSVGAFKCTGLNFWDSLQMAMRCISTGGGNFFPEHTNLYVDYVTIFVMLLSCGNFLIYHRIIHTLIPPRLMFNKIYLIRLRQYILRLKRTIFNNIQLILANEELKFLYGIIFFVMILLFLRLIFNGIYFDLHTTFRQTLFYIVSFASTTGISSLEAPTIVDDFDKFVIILMAMIGGCIGSITGGLKIIRLIVLMKITAAEIKRTIHPNMMTVIRVSNLPVPTQIVNRILGYFFIVVMTIFISATFLALTGISFSSAVSMSVACLSTVGNLLNLCTPNDFIALNNFGKIFCMIILITGRLEIFVLIIALASFQLMNKKEW